MIAEDIDIDAFFHAHRGGREAKQCLASDAYVRFLEILSDYAALAKMQDDWQNTPICSMHVDEVEDIWNAIAQRDDWTALHKKIADVRDMGAMLN